MKKEIIKKLQKLWDKYPEQRLGQLLENFVFDKNTNIWEFSNKEILKKLNKELD